MRNKFVVSLTFLLNVVIVVAEAFSLCLTDSLKTTKTAGAYYTGFYRNLFIELLGKSESEVTAKIDSAWWQLFYGDNATQRVYYPVEPDMAYVEDILHRDVRTEGMSYGMMIAVQYNKKTEFDRLWKWAKTYMQHKSGAAQGYFAWHCFTNGVTIDANSASDGEEWFAMALFFAAARWGNGQDIFNYQAEAQAILDAMLNKESTSDRPDVVTNMFNRKEHQIVFVPVGNADDFTDPSYHVPHYYELWSLWANKENKFWSEAATASRQFLKKAAHPLTGLTPDYAFFDGSPMNPPWGGGHVDFRYDAWRVAMNVALDYVWFAKDNWEIEQSNRLLTFFHAQGMGNYSDLFTIEGKKLSDNHSIGLAAMNAVAALAATVECRKDFVTELWNTPTPHGSARYYDGLLYLLAMLQVSGNFKIYDLAQHHVPDYIND